jgi:hypothetical protein
MGAGRSMQVRSLRKYFKDSHSDETSVLQDLKSTFRVDSL